MTPRIKIAILLAISPVVANALNPNCDSTCIVPQTNMVAKIPKAQVFTAKPITASPTLPAICGASAGSVLPGTPTSFLCSSGTASTVKTTTKDGEILYGWTCTSPIGTQACMANQREEGKCGSANGGKFENNPPEEKLCSTGQTIDFAFASNIYSWSCQGNYGTTTKCSASYAPKEIESEGLIRFHLVGEEASALNQIYDGWGIPTSIPWVEKQSDSYINQPCTKDPKYKIKNTNIYIVYLSTEFNSAGTVFTGMLTCE